MLLAGSEGIRKGLADCQSVQYEHAHRPVYRMEFYAYSSVQHFGPPTPKWEKVVLSDPG